MWVGRGQSIQALLKTKRRSGGGRDTGAENTLLGPDGVGRTAQDIEARGSQVGAGTCAGRGHTGGRYPLIPRPQESQYYLQVLAVSLGCSLPGGSRRIRNSLPSPPATCPSLRGRWQKEPPLPHLPHHPRPLVPSRPCAYLPGSSWEVDPAQPDTHAQDWNQS